MRMQTNEDVFTHEQMSAKILDLVGIQIGRGAFHGGWQVKNHLLSQIRSPHLAHGITDFNRKIDFRLVKTLWRILKNPLSFGILFCQIP